MAEEIIEQQLIHGVQGFEDELGPNLLALAKAVTKLGRLKSTQKQVNLINLQDLRKQLDDAVRQSEEVRDIAKSLQEQVEQYRIARSTSDQIEWTQRFRQGFHTGYPSVDGEFPNFQVFPVEVRVDFERELVLVNNRIVRSLHPEAVVGAVEKAIDRLNQERFNSLQFAKALIRVYDLLIAEARAKADGGAVGQTVTLGAVHQVLSARTGPSGYNPNQFAFDIYRLRKTEDLIVDGRRIQFGSIRNRGSVVITMPGGTKITLGTLEVLEARNDR